MTRRASHLLAAGMIAAFAAAAVAAMREKAATSDEPVHLGAGYSYVVTRDFRLNPEHPPLVKLLGGLALAPLRCGSRSTPRLFTVSRRPGRTSWGRSGSSA